MIHTPTFWGQAHAPVGGGRRTYSICSGPHLNGGRIANPSTPTDAPGPGSRQRPPR